MPDEKQGTKRNPVVDSLLEEADRMEPHLFQPNSPVASEDKVIGQVTDEYMMRLFSAATLYMRDLDQLKAEHKYSQHLTDGTCPTEARMQELSKRGSLFMDLFWFCVRTEFKAWDVEIGIRMGWRVVACPESPISQLMHRLRGML